MARSAVRMSVLVVDDEPVVLTVLSTILEKGGFAVRTTTTAEAALSALRTEQFDCLLVDKNLGPSNGLEVMRVARSLQPACACIVITGYSSTESAIEALRLGAMDYLQKPFPDVALIATKIEHALGRQHLENEHRQFLHRLSEYRQELDLKDDQVAKQATEIEMFESVLEGRVRQATADLHAEYDALEKSLVASHDRTYVLRTHAESLLEMVRTEQAAKNLPPAGRELLARLARRLELHIGLHGKLDDLARGVESAKAK